MSLVDDKLRMSELIELLDYHNHKYYVENSPEISDFEFDALLRELQDLEERYPELVDPLESCYEEVSGLLYTVVASINPS